MFVDASALCAILLGEADGPEFVNKIESASHVVTSPVAIFETVRAVLRQARGDAGRATVIVFEFLRMAEVGQVDIGQAELAIALEAMARFGKGRHPAQLNMGDCFAYACAKARGEPLLFKGDDFVRTDIDLA